MIVGSSNVSEADYEPWPPSDTVILECPTRPQNQMYVFQLFWDISIRVLLADTEWKAPATVMPIETSD